ncbi:MAG: hypothetical protein H0T78_01745 [Longispora sp.]|nr:hypothetical protein [Longispora sp. (in: high G+C Gram-positive bacteria)]
MKAKIDTGGLGRSGAKLTRKVLEEFDLDEHELVILREAARTVDTLDALALVIAKEGPMSEDRVHPAVVESRQLRLTLARLFASLRLPSGDGEDARPQRRGAARGTYGGAS